MNKIKRLGVKNISLVVAPGGCAAHLKLHQEQLEFGLVHAKDQKKKSVK